MIPSTALQLHEHATIVVDEAAASKLANRDHYKWTYANKPAWQGDLVRVRSTFDPADGGANLAKPSDV